MMLAILAYFIVGCIISGMVYGDSSNADPGKASFLVIAWPVFVLFFCGVMLFGVGAWIADKLS